MNENISNKIDMWQRQFNFVKDGNMLNDKNMWKIVLTHEKGGLMEYAEW